MKYLAEANEVREQLDNCSQELKREEVLGKTFRELNKMQFDDMLELKREIREKDIEIDRLQRKIATLMGDPNKLYPHGHVSVSHIRPEQIIERIHDIHKGIKHDQMLFKRTGIYQNFDSRIAEVRELFNLMLMQLNFLNSNNREVTRTLDSLQKLDVRKFYYHLFFMFQLQHSCLRWPSRCFDQCKSKIFLASTEIQPSKLINSLLETHCIVLWWNSNDQSAVE